MKKKMRNSLFEIAPNRKLKIFSPLIVSGKIILFLLVLRRSLQIPIPAWAMKATVFSSSGRGPYRSLKL